MSSGSNGRATAAPEPHSPAFQKYFQGIAEAHYVIRKVFRIVDEEARKAGLDPLEHKLLIQVFGEVGKPLSVNDTALRLDIAAAFVSRLVKALEAKGLITRSSSERDRRRIELRVTSEARDLLGAIDRAVRHHVDYFAAGLTDAERDGALRVFEFYVGTRTD